jgi:hypothetical protein
MRSHNEQLWKVSLGDAAYDCRLGVSGSLTGRWYDIVSNPAYRDGEVALKHNAIFSA